ncbi:MAG: amidohydrolase family protein, partial [Bacteroidota bacterium]
MKFWYTSLLLLCLTWACSPEPADLVIVNGKIYTLDEQNPQAQAVAVRDGRILEAGTSEAIKAYISPATEVIDLEGKTLVPGFIESHGHILGLGRFKRELDLTQVANYKELVSMVKQAAERTPEGTWILGRGWHQSKWIPQPEIMVKGYQIHDALSAVSPDHPVMLTHASGHAVFANQKAMEMAGISPQTRVGADGEIIRDGRGNATGIFTEDAEELIAKYIPKDTKESLRRDLDAAIQECLSYGITSFQDAGSNARGIEVYREALAE